ncbi:ubiquitin-specific protease ubp1 [Paramarasmius palmivorus]|uniref:ubiquitinyl hydrolase 1 n=1 Tax=Paramarasmius palmivorus TaxID=297713 RepID=A0AAW0BTQ2_9AGAR
MVLENLLPWNWGHGSGSTTSITHHEKRRSRKKSSKAAEGTELSIHKPGDGYYPGLVNISGTYCFMNSTVQALSSLSYLQPHLDAIHEKAELLDVPTPVIDTLRDLLHRLNSPHSRPSSIRPMELIQVLSTKSGLNSLISSREHQDAQELFQLLSECIKSEITAIDKEQARDRGLGGLAQFTEPNKEIGKSVFDGLTAHRRSCVVCGYTEAVMHFPFDNWQLAVPRMASTCLLEDCLTDYTRLEVLKDCICRKCSLNATHRRLIGELETLSQAQNPTPSKKKRLKEVKKMEAKPPPVLALHINRSMHFTHYASKNNIRILFPEVLDLTPFTTSGNLSIVPTSSMSTPSPPPQRSSSFSPTPSVSAGSSRSRSGTPTLESQKEALSPRLFVTMVPIHLGTMCASDGNQKGGVPESERWKPPKLVVETVLPPPTEMSAVDGGIGLDGNEENAEGFEDYVWEDSDPETAPGTGRGWLRISDDSVNECGIESVLQEGSGAFMLYYERAIISAPAPLSSTESITLNGSAKHESPYPIRNGLNGGYQGVGVGVGTPLDSEETLKPETMTTMSSIHINGSASVGSLVSSIESTKEKAAIHLSSSLGAASWSGGSISGSPPVMGARIIRSVAAGRGKRSMSATPSLNGSTTLSSSPASSSAMSSSLPISSTKPIPMPNGHIRKSNGDIDGFESVDHDEAAADASPKSQLGMSSSPQIDMLSTRLRASLSNTSLSSMTSSTSSISPPSSTVSSNPPHPKSTVRKRKKTANSHSPSNHTSHKQSPIVV